eukprot:3941334-Amphidinium_carterae.1
MKQKEVYFEVANSTQQNKELHCSTPNEWERPDGLRSHDFARLSGSLLSCRVAGWLDADFRSAAHPSIVKKQILRKRQKTSESTLRNKV